MFQGSIFDISASGLTAERMRLDIIGSNIANVNTTRTTEGGPYKRLMPVFEPRTPNFGEFLKNIQSSSSSKRNVFRGDVSYGPLGVRVTAILEDSSPPRLVYDPSHPDANQDGYVAYPDINIVKEMVDMISASRAYEANVTALNEAKTMMQNALNIGRV